MEKERSDQPSGGISPSSFEVRHFRSVNPNDPTRYKALALNHFSEAAIRELLTQMAVGYNPGKSIAFMPKESENREPETISGEKLYELRDKKEDDRQTQIAVIAARIKDSYAILMIQKYMV